MTDENWFWLVAGMVAAWVIEAGVGWWQRRKRRKRAEKMGVIRPIVPSIEKGEHGELR